MQAKLHLGPSHEHFSSALADANVMKTANIATEMRISKLPLAATFTLGFIFVLRASGFWTKYWTK
jgi:hypothetical protein